MTVRKLLAGLTILVLLSFLWSGLRDSADVGTTTSVSPAADATPTARTAAAPEREFTAADSQDALEAICSDDAEAGAEQAPDQTYEQMLQSASESLAVSPSAEHLLAAALMETDSASQLDLIERALLANSTDPLLLWSAVRICSDSPDSLDCPLQEWEQRLIAVDGQNSESWARIASNRYAAGDVSAALEAMRFASTATESRIYWPEMMELIERELRAVGNFPFPMRVSVAMGVAASELPRNPVTTMCREQSPESQEWAYTCLRYGELAERQAKTLYGIGIAGSVQRLVLEATGEPEKAVEVEERIRVARQVLIASNDEEVLRLITTIPNLFYSYIAALKSVGEVAAKGHIAADVERLANSCARPEPPPNLRPEWLTMRDTTEFEAIYTDLRQAGSPNSESMTRVESRTGLGTAALDAFRAFGVEVFQRDRRRELVNLESFCDSRAPMTRQALLLRLESMTTAEKQLQEDAVNELFRRLSSQALAALRSAYAPDTRTWPSRTSETDFAAMVDEVNPTEMRDRACTALAAARRQE